MEEQVESIGTGNVIDFKAKLTAWDSIIDEMVATFQVRMFENGIKEDESSFINDVIKNMTFSETIHIKDKHDLHLKWNHKAKKDFYAFLLDIPIERIKKIKDIDFNRFQDGKVPINYLTAVLRAKTQEEILSENYKKTVTTQYNDIKEIIHEFITTQGTDYDDLNYLVTTKFLKIQKDITAMKLTDEAKAKLKSRCYQEQIKFNEWVKVKKNDLAEV